MRNIMKQSRRFIVFYLKKTCPSTLRVPQSRYYWTRLEKRFICSLECGQICHARFSVWIFFQWRTLPAFHPEKSKVECVWDWNCACKFVRLRSIFKRWSLKPDILSLTQACQLNAFPMPCHVHLKRHWNAWIFYACWGLSLKCVSDFKCIISFFIFIKSAIGKNCCNSYVKE